MAKPKKPTTQELKDEFLRFYVELPVQKAGADFVGVNEDTITDWKANDPAFSDAVKKAKSEWAKRNFKKTNPDGLLSRLYPDLKPAKQEVDTTIKGNFTFNYVRPNDQLPSDTEARPRLALPDRPDND